MKSARRIGFFPRCGSNEGDEVSLERENIFPLPAYSRKGAIFHDSIHLLGYSHFYISRVIFRFANDREFHDTFHDNSRNVSYLNHVQKGTWKGRFLSLLLSRNERSLPRDRVINEASFLNIWEQREIGGANAISYWHSLSAGLAKGFRLPTLRVTFEGFATITELILDSPRQIPDALARPSTVILTRKPGHEFISTPCSNIIIFRLVQMPRCNIFIEYSNSMESRRFCSMPFTCFPSNEGIELDALFVRGLSRSGNGRAKLSTFVPYLDWGKEGCYSWELRVRGLTSKYR